MEAIKNNCYALEYASKELRDDKEVVMEAVKQNVTLFSLSIIQSLLVSQHQIVFQIPLPNSFS